MVKRKRGDSENQPERRVSLRVQEKLKSQQKEKERLVLDRVKLLDDDKNSGRGTGMHGTRKDTIHENRDSAGRASPRVKEMTLQPMEISGISRCDGEDDRDLGGTDNGGLNHVDGNAKTPMEKAAHVKVRETLRLFNKHYLHFVQAHDRGGSTGSHEEEKRCGKTKEKAKGESKSKGKRSRKGSEASNSEAKLEEDAPKARRPDLKAISKMKSANEVLYPRKRIGNLPGIEVGHRFFSRAEMCALGFHGHWLNGIDFMGNAYQKGEYSHYTFPLAVSIVISGMYEDDLDNADEVVYTGQGGHNLTGNKRQIRDQTLERGNLALKNCVDHSVPVRVIRGLDCKSSYTKRVYTYDGLYKVVRYWAEKGISGYTVFKYQLKRVDGQPELTTNQVSFVCGRVPQSTSEIQGLVCKDITRGLENIPIPATNRVDDPPVAPTGFTYSKALRVESDMKTPRNAPGCSCRGKCTDPRKCACAKLNGGDFPYVNLNDGRLVEAKDVIFECGPNCGCGPDCLNRTSQKGLRFHLEVFRSPKKGWGVRSWDYIPAGSPVCEYIGVLKRTDDVDTLSDNNYIFEIDCLQTMQGIGGRERRQKDVCVKTTMNISQTQSGEEDQNAPEFCIDAGSKGNIARFINHSCEPNLFVQCVLSSHHDLRLARVMLFAADNIPPMQELTYDYGYTLDSVHDPDGNVKQLSCYCGAIACRKRLY